MTPKFARIVFASVCLAVRLCAAGPVLPPGVVFDDLNGVPHHPLDPAEKSASVFIFYWHDCPVCNGYAPEINRLWAAHTNCAFYIVQVDPDLTPAMAKDHARRYDLRPAVLLDHQHRLVQLATF